MMMERGGRDVTARYAPPTLSMRAKSTVRQILSLLLAAASNEKKPHLLRSRETKERKKEGEIAVIENG